MKYLGRFIRPADIATKADLDALSSDLGAASYSEVIGDGTETEFIVIHNTGGDVVTAVYETTGDMAEVETLIERIDATSVRVSFGKAPAAGEYRVVVLGAGATQAGTPSTGGGGGGGGGTSGPEPIQQATGFFPDAGRHHFEALPAFDRFSMVNLDFVEQDPQRHYPAMVDDRGRVVLVPNSVYVETTTLFGAPTGNQVVQFANTTLAEPYPYTNAGTTFGYASAERTVIAQPLGGGDAYSTFDASPSLRDNNYQLLAGATDILEMYRPDLSEAGDTRKRVRVYQGATTPTTDTWSMGVSLEPIPPLSKVYPQVNLWRYDDFANGVTILGTPVPVTVQIYNDGDASPNIGIFADMTGAGGATFIMSIAAGYEAPTGSGGGNKGGFEPRKTLYQRAVRFTMEAS